MRKFVQGRGLWRTKLLLAVEVCARKGCFVHRVAVGEEVCARRWALMHKVAVGEEVCAGKGALAHKVKDPGGLKQSSGVLEYSGAGSAAAGKAVYRPADLFLYSAMQASKRSWAVVSPGTLCEGWM